MRFERFEDIIIWQRSRALACEIYKLFSTSKDFGFRDQIQRAAVSVMNNIAEGYERKSNAEFKHFLFVAKGSCGEVRSMLYLALDLNYISQSTYNLLVPKTVEISKMLSGLIKKL